MKRILAFVAVLVLGVGLAIDGSGSVAAQTTVHDQTDAVSFTLNWLGSNETWVTPDQYGWGDMVYCGVAANAEPYELDVAVVAPPLIQRNRRGQESLVASGYDFVGWLGVALQDPQPTPDPNWPDQEFTVGSGYDFNVPTNGSFAFSLTLGGRPGVDQMVMIFSKPAGDPWGNGYPISGFASVRANPDAIDPFEGDGRDDNFCVSIGLPEGYAQGGTWEYIEGDISTALPVPDDWVVDGDGTDGGFLRGFPH